jgi:hypothetical protein
MCLQPAWRGQQAGRGRGMRSVMYAGEDERGVPSLSGHTHLVDVGLLALAVGVGLSREHVRIATPARFRPVET